MRLLFQSIFLYSIIIGPCRAARAETDRSILRVANSIYFHSELKSMQRVLSYYKCGYDSSILIKLFGLQGKALRTIGNGLELVENPNITEKERAKFEQQTLQLIHLLRLREFVKTQNSQVSSRLVPLVLRSIEVRGCAGPLSSELKEIIGEIMKIEVFLRSRFNNESFWVTQTEIDRENDKNLGLSKKETEQALKLAKMKKAFELFIQTLIRQFPIKFLF